MGLVPEHSRDGATLETVAVGTDGSPTATKAVKFALDLAERFGARVVFITSYRPVSESRLKHEHEHPRRVGLGIVLGLHAPQRQREEQAGEHDEEQRDPIDAQVPRDPERLDPVVLRDELEAVVVHVELGHEPHRDGTDRGAGARSLDRAAR